MPGGSVLNWLADSKKDSTEPPKFGHNAWPQKSEKDNKIARSLEVGLLMTTSPNTFLSTWAGAANSKQYYPTTTPQALTSPIEIEGLVLDPISPASHYWYRPLEMGPQSNRLLNFWWPTKNVLIQELSCWFKYGWQNVYVEERTVECTYTSLTQSMVAHDSLIQTVRRYWLPLLSKKAPMKRFGETPLLLGLARPNGLR